MKLCSICKQNLELSSFGQDRYKRDGLTVTCKPCSKLVRNGLRAQPKPKPTHRSCNTCSQHKPMSDYYKYSCKCKACTLAHMAAKRVPKQRVLSNRTQSVYKRNKRSLDPMFKLRSNVGTLIANSLSNHGYIKTSTTADILGCSIAEFKIYLESQFVQGMSWANRSEWHIDHIVPQAFARTEQELLLLNHYTNLRPIWKLDNLSKGAAIVELAQEHPLYKLITEHRIPL